jgi:hypothetical protein
LNPSDATLDLQKASNGDLNGTVVLTELRKQTVDLELQNAGMPAACVSSIALSVLHGNSDLVGGTALLNLSNGAIINLVF